MRHGFRAAALSAAGLASAALGQERAMAPPPSHEVAVGLDSGVVRPRAGVEGPQVLWAGGVSEPGAAWMRLTFAAAVLPGDGGRGDATIIRVTSMEDGAVQELDARGLARWSGTSAYFNGDSVWVELVAWEGSGYGAGECLPAQVRVASATAGDPPFSSRSICGPTDDRELSSDPRVARYMPNGCTAWLIDDANHQLLTAGHCGVGSAGVCEFNVPLSQDNGVLRHPPPEDQYPVEPTSVQARNDGEGEDYAYFGCWPNDQDVPAFERQGACFTLAASVPGPSATPVRVTGFGVTRDPVPMSWNQAQKTMAGPYVQRSGTILYHTVDTTGGNSGSPMVLDATNTAIGIHTNGGCDNGPGAANTGTSLDNSGLRYALAHPRGICNPGFGTIEPPVYAAGDSSRQFGTLSARSGASGFISTLLVPVDGLAYDQNRGVFWATTTDRVLGSIDPATGAFTAVGTLTGTSRSVAGLAFDPAADTLYGIIQVGGRLVRISTQTAAVTPLGAPGGNNIGALDFDPASRTIYGIDDASTGSRLVRVDAVTGAQTVVGNLGAGINDCNALAFNTADGFLYTVNATTEQMLRVDPATGTATVIGPTGLLWGSNSGMACRVAPPCRPDFNADGFLDFFDYDDFVACFELEVCPAGATADFNGDGFADFFDYDDFVAAFEAGC
jgi:hypothetical protein